MHFGTNHLGHFQLTRLLARQLESADGTRVVNLSSDGHKLADVDLDDPNWHARDYNKFRAYGCEVRQDVVAYARDAERAHRLWQLSETLCAD